MGLVWSVSVSNSGQYLSLAHPDHVHLTQKQRVTLQLEDFSLSNFSECGLALQLAYFLEVKA